jgi:hypothetical protein
MMNSDHESFDALKKAIDKLVAQFTRQRRTTLNGEAVAAAMISNAAALWARNPVSRTRNGRREILREVSKLFETEVMAGHQTIDKSFGPSSRADCASSPPFTSSALNRIDLASQRQLNSIWEYAVFGRELVTLGG